MFEIRPEPSFGSTDQKDCVDCGDALDPSNLDYLTSFRQDAGVPNFVQQVGFHQSDPDAGTLTPQTLSDLNGASVG